MTTTHPSILKTTAERIAEIPEFRPRSALSGARYPYDNVDVPIIACNSSALPRDNAAKQFARRPSTPLASTSTPLGNTIRKSRENGKKRSSRVRSASAGRDRKTEMASRYWAYLFENLERSISEIYDTCEKQDSILQCKEVLLILENYTHDFTNLIEWLNLKWTYEQTPQPMRPNALAWEIRKPSFSALPHTRAYEKLVGLSSSPPSKAKPEPKPVLSAATPVIVVDHKPLVSAPIITPPPNVIAPTPVNPVSVPPTVDIGLQTDLEEDPDIYYFAGGRHVASLTDYNEEYGPLDLFGAGSNPVIIVLTSSDYELETVRDESASASINDAIPSPPAPALTVEAETPSPCPPAEIMTVSPHIETKSSSTQLSVGVLVLSESMSSQSDPDGEVTLTATATTETQTAAMTAKTAEEPTTTTSPKVEPTVVAAEKSSTATASTFADKARNGMLRQGQGSLVHRSAAPGASTTSTGLTFMRPTLSSTAAATISRGKTGDHPRVNYRSNIASRFRTAVNTGQPHVVATATANQVLSPKHSASVPVPSHSTSTATSQSLRTHYNQAPHLSPKSTNYGAGSPRTQGQGHVTHKIKPLVLSVATTPALLNSDAMQSTESSSIGNKVPIRAGVSRSKSMINPVEFTNRSKGKGVNSEDKSGIPPIPQTKSFVSLPDESARSNARRRSSNVDEDGWETVRNRSNRSKWSPSSSSLHSSSATLSRTSLDKGGSLDSQNPPAPATDVKPVLTSTASTSAGGTKKGRPAQATSKFLSSRFYQPSSTTSLPVLLLLEEDGSGNTMASPTPAEELQTSQKKQDESKSSNKRTQNSTTNVKGQKKVNPTSTANIKSAKTILEKSKTLSGSSNALSSSAPSSSTLTKSTDNSTVSGSSKTTVSVKAKVKSTVGNKNIGSSGNIPSGKNLKAKQGVSTNATTSNKVTAEVSPAPLESVALVESKAPSECIGDHLERVTSPTENKGQSVPETQMMVNANASTKIIVKDADIGEDETEIACGVDDEEIKKTEAALDIAIREEELLEEELLQVEKDFEEIENQSNHGDVISVSENENLISSPEVHESDVTDLESSVLETNEEEDNLEEDEYFFLGKDARAAEEFLPREPGRIVTLRDKLMSPARRYDSAETLKRHQAKLAKAERNRERLLQSKYNRYVELSEKFESLNESTKRLVEERAELIVRAEARRKNAAEKRQLYLKGIKMKAHDEDSKAREIAFINRIEASNKRHDYFASAQEIEDRLQMREEERKLKLEERGTKANAVLQRQFRIRNNWESKLKEIQEKRRRNEERITREKEERAKERSDLAQEKARDREERISALNAAKQAEKEELQKKIQQRQEDTARRHDENIEQIRQKAIELSVPRNTEESSGQTSVRMCTLCQVTMQSEVQELAHLRGRAHLDAIKKTERDSNSNSSVGSQFGAENFGIRYITDVQVDKLKPGVTNDKNRVKTLKKHCKKLLQKLETSGLEYESEESAKRSEKLFKGDSKLVRQVQKNVKEMARVTALFCASKGSLQLASSLDKLLSETRRLAVRNRFIQDAMVGLGAIGTAAKLLNCRSTDLPTKVIVSACHFIVGCIYQNLPNTIYVLRSSCVCAILEFTATRWNTLVPDDNRWLCGSPLGANEPLPVDTAVEAIVELLFNVINIIPDPFTGITNVLPEPEKKLLRSRTLDIAGYLVGSGVIDRLSVYCSGIRGPVDTQPLVADLLNKSLDLLTCFVYALDVSWDRSKSDTTQLLATLESTELAGAVSMSYSLLLHQGAPTRPRQGPDPVSDTENNHLVTPPPPPGIVTGAVVKSTVSLINAVAHLDINILQNVLGSEAISLQFRHIVSQLLWQVVPHRTVDLLWGRLLNELLLAIGNFTVLNKQNQITIQSGQTPTVLQQLCCVPDNFFVDPKLTSGFFPTLIACTYGCPENRAVLIQENIDPELLEGFLKSEFAKKNTVTKRILATSGLTNGVGSNEGNINGNLPSTKKSKKSQPKT